MRGCPSATAAVETEAKARRAELEDRRRARFSQDSCPSRHQCFGCKHFRTDPSSQPELRDYLHKLLLDRERLAAAIPALADWAQHDATPSEQEITAVRALIRRNDQLIDQLDPADRAAVTDAIAVTRRVRAQLATEIPTRFRLATSQPRPTLSPRAHRGTGGGS